MNVFGRRLAYTSLALGASAAAGGSLLYRRHHRSTLSPDTKYYVSPGGTALSASPGGAGKAPYLPPSREAMISKMKQEKFDVLVIGGGASVGRASKRHCVCLLVRLSLVCEALEERAHILTSAPYLAQPLAILMPIYKVWQIPYFWTGTKAYAFIANLVCFWDTCVPPTSYLAPATTQFALPLLPKQGLKGSLLYFDGQMNDSRLCLSLCLTPTVPGFVDGMKEAAAANYIRVKELLKDENGKIIGVRVEDRETNEEFPIYSKVVVNCTGTGTPPAQGTHVSAAQLTYNESAGQLDSNEVLWFCILGPLADLVRKMDNEEAHPVVLPAAGAHIVLPHWYTHFTPFGLLLPETSDGRVLFLLPWEGQTIAGTTDAPALGSRDPRAKSVDVDFLVQEISSYLGVDPEQMRADIQSVWCGHRPLVSQTQEGKDTAGVVRSHTVLVDESSGLVTLLGGKWTTYRRMAEDAVNTLLEAHKDKLAPATGCRTRGMKVQGAVDPLGRLKPQDCNFNSGRLEHELSSSFPTLTFDQKQHLIRSYGFLARDVLNTGEQEGLLEPLVPGFPYLKAEVVYACR
ncbi:hypothetical protein Emag_000510 [Eimeria magna]